MSKKHLMDFRVAEVDSFGNGYSLLKLSPIGEEMPLIMGGQFVNIQVNKSKNTFLRRPISVNFVDYEQQLLWLLVKDAGEGTHALCQAEVGETLNLLLPLGRGFSVPAQKEDSILLIGGGVGTAPMLYWGKILKDNGYNPRFLLGGRKESDLLELDEFRQIGEVFVSTEDGSAGEQGFVTVHSVMQSKIDKMYCCGPAPMMKAIAKIAAQKECECEVSLENKMACGLGACLCCVEDSKEGNVCVCTSGPVFNTKELKWEI
ncbi:MAG: dihydroorotate dehydrogenase electron transfer subunit [Muribaculaceae bacterium]|jgi:dihydroorotate dehydrogenase electron transfer subunit|nr:dihydroorotate dehydrogenase electron transfer subunit [Muribaculaceae bacterium]MBQ2370844.1 dihydroorotate dehydrogenase electron transfer subunit [Muribaculaceae bacterium]MBQ2399921.1 dihydroorotate dehydrogenase electron transfer subunit [Muribaculaceae bacterium]MBR5787773.1 dihydroorotate dehydrogenase electron transfer subunit [Muribaculaceae bacterium]MEE1365343.1 dihydroorotate dehydrogenase electron transfer subunit [Muribaculaceae bacterium]